MTDTQEHPALASLRYEDDILLWGGRKLTDIADETGTPFYAYDCARMSARVAELREALPEGLHLHYAMKANPMPEVVRHMVGLVDGLDVASAGELEVALATGVNPADVSFAGPGKQDFELEAAIRAGITINMESEGEMRRIAALAGKHGSRPHVAIRVNSPFELKTSGMKMGGRPSPFGVDAERVPAMLAELKSLGLHFRGFHIYSGSQNLRAEAIIESMTSTVDLVLQLADSTDLEISFVNLGGGLGIPYFPKEQPLDLAAISTPADEAVSRLRKALGDPEILMELGRYLVGEAGIYVCRVIDIKESRGTRYAITDGGLHHHLAASGNFGQIIRKNYPVVAIERCDAMEPVTVVGPLCTPLDLLGDKVSIDKLEAGSLVGILQSGAYGKTASPERFLSHPACSEILL
ncbi:pyridoxal-dependent decarboxylase, exosortase A system-associated [Lentisalinibacter orientalis]|uniref:pyridoxal-dependent decarboxylase, exosortase A system-associated n=1 Tax=Lentisalinibacter orientalis TaxID=2992241 RepID=UPI003865A4E6